MQATQHISEGHLREIVAAIYDQGPAVVTQAYSDPGRAPRRFIDADALIDELRYQPGQEYVFSSYVIYYPEAKGHTYEKRTRLDPAVFDGHTFRFETVGWGLIQLQCSFHAFPKVECCISVNSEARAGNWAGVSRDLKRPDLWDWAVVQRKAGKLIRLLRKLGKQAGPRR
jgi:hypothetical protein